MAEGGQGRVGLEAAGDAPDGTLLQSGEVTYKGKEHYLHLLQTGLRLVAPQGRDKAGTTQADVPVVSVTWRDVVCACEAPIKKSKSSQKHSEAGWPDTTHSKLFVVHYINKNPKTKKLQCKDVLLETRQGTAEGWITQIEEKRKEGKPQKLLVVINPIGGKGTARQVFEKRVQPIFALAGVELVVKLTERARHAVEIAKSFAVTSVDGVIAMGGDGLYMEILHGLTLRKQEEEGVDFNDPDATLIPPAVRVGIVPAGTGNGVSGWFNGVIDVDTATLNIIRGETSRANIFSIHEAGKLIHYAGLLLGNGYFSDIIQRSEDLRWMKRARYPYVMLTAVLGKKKVLQFDIEVLKNELEPNDKEERRSEEAAASASGWTKLGPKQLTATMAFAAKILDDGELMELNPFYPGFDLLILDKASALENLKFIFSFFTRKKNALEKQYVEWVRDIRGMRFELSDSLVEEGAGSRQQAELDICKILDVDGEVIALSAPKFDVRLHSGFLQVFCVPGLYSKDHRESK